MSLRSLVSSLFLVLIASASAPVDLNAQVPRGGSVRELRISPDAGEQWFTGTLKSQWGRNCVIVGGAYDEIMIQSQVSYYGRSDLSYPRVGEKYYGSILVSIPGNACADGITDVWTEIVLPSGTSFDTSETVKCYYRSPSTGQWSDVSGTNVCVNYASQGSYGGSYLGYRNLARGSQFEVVFPIYSTRVMNGIGDNSSWMEARIASSDVFPDSATYPNNSIGKPGQWIWVSSYPPSVTYPSPSTTSITQTTAHSDANLFNRYTSGNAYFDIGTTTGYGTVTGPYAVANSYNAAIASQDWTGLTPGTLYHWRLRFVASGGVTYTGADQVFTTSGSAPAPPSSVEMHGDFNGDGKDDILLRDTSGNVGVWLMNGHLISSGGSVGSSGAYTIAGIGDFNGDGRSDILLRDPGGTLGMWIMNGFTITSGHLVGSPGAYTVAGVGDFNADGKADILLRDSGGTLGLWIMNGHVVTSGHLVGSPGAYTVAGVGDFNADSKADILLRDSGGTLGMWIMNGHIVTSGHLVGSPGAYSVVGTSDFTGDNKADIVLRDSLGNIGMWVMNGHIVTSGHLVGSPGGYKVNSVGDYNGNGTADVLLRYDATGEIGMWIMNGHLIVSGHAVGSPGSSFAAY